MWDAIMWGLGIVIPALLGLIGKTFKDIKDEIKMVYARLEKQNEKVDTLETRFEAHRLYAAETFATKQDVNAGFDRVMNKLEKIDDKLNGKVDKK